MAGTKRTGPTTDTDAGPRVIKTVASNIDIETLIPQLQSGEYTLTFGDRQGPRSVCRAHVCQLQILGASDRRLIHFGRLITSRYRVCLRGLVPYKVDAKHAHFDRRYFHVPCFEAMSIGVQRCLRLPPELVWTQTTDYNHPVLTTNILHEAIVDWVRLGGRAYDAILYERMRSHLLSWREAAHRCGIEWAESMRPVSSAYIPGEPVMKRLSDVLVEVRCGPFPVPDDPVVRMIVLEYGAGEQMHELVELYKPGAMAFVQEKSASEQSEVNEQPSSDEDSGLEGEPRVDEQPRLEDNFGLGPPKTDEQPRLDQESGLEVEPDPGEEEDARLGEDSGLEEERNLEEFGLGSEYKPVQARDSEDLAATDIVQEWSGLDVVTPDDFLAVRNLTELAGVVVAERIEGPDGADVGGAEGAKGKEIQK